MPQSLPIVVDGVLLGTAVPHDFGVQFVASDSRVAEMDRSIWPSSDYARQSAKQILRTAPIRRADSHTPERVAP